MSMVIRDAGMCLSVHTVECLLTLTRIVEYATRDQAQQAISTLSNQNLMGRLVYVREVRHVLPRECWGTANIGRTVKQNRDLQDPLPEAILEVVLEAVVLLAAMVVKVGSVGAHPAVEVAVSYTSRTFVSLLPRLLTIL